MSKAKEVKELIDHEWDPWYCKMLDAVREYMDNMEGEPSNEITDRDIRIIRALIEFYGFEPEDIAVVLDDVETRIDQLEREKKDERH